MSSTPASRMALVLVAALPAACSLAPEYEAPATAQVAAWKEAGEWQPAVPADTVSRGAWWERFDDATLNELQQRLPQGSQDLRAAAARYDAARAAARLARSDLFPTIDANASATRARSSANAPRSVSSSIGEDYAATLGFSWEIDLFGRLRNQNVAARNRAAATGTDLAAVELALRAELAADYFSLRGLDATIDLLQNAAGFYDGSLSRIRNRYQSGVAAATDVDQAQALQATTQAQLSSARLQRARLEHAIAVLLGEPAGNFSLAASTTLGNPPAIDLVLPASLLQRRPDIASAERAVAAANAEIGVARAAWFPVFSFGASGGYESAAAHDWFSAPSRIWALGPALGMTLLDAGRRSGISAQARAYYDEAAAQYRQVTLGRVPRSGGRTGGAAPSGRRTVCAGDCSNSGNLLGPSRRPALCRRHCRLPGSQHHADHCAAGAARGTGRARRPAQRRRRAGARLRRRLGRHATSGGSRAAMSAIESADPVPGIKRTCMRDRIRDTLVARILDGQYAPGTQLKELALAREFKVSQAPIREALRELEGSGLVTSERYRGTRVRGADAEELRQSYDVRQTIEIRAVELAIPVEPAALVRMQAQLASMYGAIAQGDVERYIDAALALHRGLIEASGNRVFLTVWDSLHFDIRGRIVLRQMAELGRGFDALLQLHAELVARIGAADAAGATATLRNFFARIAEVVGSNKR